MRAVFLFASAGLATLLASVALAGEEGPCPGDNPPFNVFAGAGDTCNVSGNYESSEGIAMHAQGGTIIWTNAEGEGGPALSTISTSASGTPAVQADSGGSISLSPTPSFGQVITGGDNAAAILVTDSGSTITASGVVVITSGNNSVGLLAENGGGASFADGSITTYGPTAAGVVAEAGESGGGDTNGGSALGSPNAAGSGSSTDKTISLSNTTVVTFGTGSDGVVAISGGSVSFSGGAVTTSGDDAAGLCARGSGSNITTTNGTTIVTGAPPPSDGGGEFAAAATSPRGAYAYGVEADSGGDVSLTGGKVTTNGHNAYGLYATGTGSQIGATDVAVSTVGFESVGVLTTDSATTNVVRGSIATSGDGAYAVVSNSRGLATLSGTSISTTGNGSGGLAVNGSGSEIDATKVTITTKGGFDPVSGLHAYGVYNGPYGDFASGGVVKLTDVSVSTAADQMYGVFTSTGGAMTISGGSINTSGVGATGVLTSSGGVTNLNGASVATTGQDAYALAVSGSGSRANLGGTNTFSTLGYGAVGLYVTQGGVLAATGQVNVTTSGGVSPATGLGAFGINADGAGSTITLGSATIATSGVGATGLYVSDALGSGSAGSIAATGVLNIKTTNPAATAVALQGDGAQVLASGGGSIASAGNAIAFLGGSKQTATFDNFTINTATGDLVFADPSTATVNFNNTIANAGQGNLLDATGGSVVTLNSSASTLTGAIQTDASSTSTVNLASNSVWTMTASSVLSHLAVTNSAIVFAPPGSGGGFKTLVLGSYVGSGATLTMNMALGESSSPTDQIIIKGGQATGSTILSINNVGGSGAQTTGNGIPIIVATNGGSIASGAFTLPGPVIVNGYKYTLSQTGQAYYLVSSSTSPPSPPTPPSPPSPPSPPVPPLTATVNDIANSLTNVARSQQQQLITNRVLTSILLGATEQINCSNCSSGFGAIGSYALGAHGRWGLSDNVTLMGGFSYGEYSADNATVSNAPTVAGSIVYDFVNWGRSRPFLEAGVGLTPYSEVSYTRPYQNGYVSAIGHGKGINRNAGLFGRVGWVDRLTPIDEAAVYADISRNWMSTGGYAEAATGSNPYPATVQTGLDTLNIVRVGGQYTHLFFGRVEGNVSAAVAHGFDGAFGSSVNVYNFGTVSPYPVSGNSTWVEYGARVGYRLKDRLVLDAFVVGTVGGQIGATAHGGLGLRYMF